jgi:transcription elongation factor Elf1
MKHKIGGWYAGPLECPSCFREEGWKVNVVKGKITSVYCWACEQSFEYPFEVE